MTLRSLVAACGALLAACAAEMPAPPPAVSSESPASMHVASPKPPEKPATSNSAPAKPTETAAEKHVASSAATTPKPGSKPSTPAKPPAKPQANVASTAPAPAAAKPAAPAPLDLKSLEERLKETNAIGVLTKLSLKNQVDDLVGEFRAYHQGARPPTLSDLRPAFELLLMKVLSLLQDRDPALAHDVSASRDAIWGVLTDPRKLAQFD